MLTKLEAGPSRPKPGRRKLRALLFAVWIFGAPVTAFVALAQNAMTVDTPALGMTGWRPDPVVVNTPVLGMTGWRTDPVVVNTPVLGMTGWRTVEVLSGTLDLRDPNGTACPRQAEAGLSIRASAAGPAPYSLDCTGDRKWSRVATAHQTAPNTFIAVDVLQFEIGHSEQVNCALKSLQVPRPKIIALRGHHYDCIKGPGLVADPTPPSGPPRIVADPPIPTCVGGRLIAASTKPVRYSCRCPPGQTAEAAGPHSFRCQGRTTVDISCAGGTVRSGQCICPSNMKRVPTGASAWRCTGQPPTQISCSGGTASGGQCNCSQNMQRVQAGPNTWRCVRRTQSVHPKITTQQSRPPNRRRR